MRRDPLNIRKRASDDCSFKNSLVSVSKTAWYPFQKQPGIRFKNSLVSVSKTAWYPFQKQPGIRFKSGLVSGSLRSFRHDGWGRRATTPDVATARRRRAADCARREGLPTVTVRSRRTHLPLRTGPQDFTDAATARPSCERERARPARAAAECGGAPGGRPSVSSRRWQGAVVASGRGARRPATASLQLDARAGLLELGLELVGLLALDALLDGLGSLIDEGLGLLQTEASRRPDDRDDLDFLSPAAVSRTSTVLDSSSAAAPSPAGALAAAGAAAATAVAETPDPSSSALMRSLRATRPGGPFLANHRFPSGPVVIPSGPELTENPARRRRCSRSRSA